MAILRVRDADGKVIEIPAIKGDPGKSAYEYAKSCGYTGTEEEFALEFTNVISSINDLDSVCDEVIALQNSYIQGVKVIQNGDTLIFENGGEVNA